MFSSCSLPSTVRGAGRGRGKEGEGQGGEGQGGGGEGEGQRGGGAVRGAEGWEEHRTLMHVFINCHPL